MKILFVLLISCFVVQAIATENHKIQVSRTFSVKMPFKFLSQAELLSLNSKLYRVVDEDISSRPAEVLIVHNTPDILANKFSAERYWKDSRNQTRSIDKKETDFGCKRKTARTYECSRHVAQNGKFIAETLHLNSKNDLVLVRASTLSSFEDSKKFLAKIDIEKDSRLPASGGVK